MRLAFENVLTDSGWRRDVAIDVDDAGTIVAIEDGATNATPGFVVPGLPNLHSHAFQRALAGYTEHAAPGQQDSFWTWRTRMYELALTLEPDAFEAIAAQLYVEMLEAGMTAVGEFHYLHHAPDGSRYDRPHETSERIVAAATRTGIALTHLPVLYLAGGFGRPPEDHQRRFVHRDVDEFYATIAGVEAAIAANPTMRLGIAPHSLRAVPPPALAEAIDRAPGPIHIHIAEQTKEVDEAVATLGARPVAWLFDNAQVDERFCLVHATHVDETETKKLATSGAIAGLCPTTEANLGDGIFPAEAYLAAKGRFGIGSDSHVTVSASEELRLLEYGQRLTTRRRNVLATDSNHVGTNLWSLAADGGAKALAQPAGAIAVGRRADLVRLDPTHPRLAGHDAETALDAWIFGSTDEPVADVWVAGRHLVKDGRHIERDAVRAAFVKAVER